MGSKKFDIMSEPGQVNQLLNSASRDMGGRGKKVTFLPRDLLEPLPDNEDVYSVINLEAIAKDISETGVRQPLIVFKNDHGKYFILAGNRRLAACDLAAKMYGSDVSSLPCIIQPAPETHEALLKRMIKDNLQRDKTGYERMREIVVYRQALEAEWARTPDVKHDDMRDVLKTELDASESEITRFLKINKSLIPGLIQKYSKRDANGNELMTTFVAYKLAREEDAVQEYVLNTYDWSETLTGTQLTSTLASYYDTQAVLKIESPEESDNVQSDGPATADMPDTNAAPAAPAKKEYHFTSMRDGTAHLSKACSDLHATISTQSELDPKTEKRYIKRITAEIAKVEALIAEIQLYQSRMGYAEF